MNAIADLAEDRVVEGVYAVARKQRLRTKGGASYLALELVDPSGRVDARIWNDVDLLDARFDEGDAVRVLGRVERFRDRLQVEVRSLEKAAETDPAALTPTIRRDRDELDGFLEFLAGEVAHPGLRATVAQFVDDAAVRERLPHAAGDARLAPLLRRRPARAHGGRRDDLPRDHAAPSSTPHRPADRRRAAPRRRPHARARACAGVQADRGGTAARPRAPRPSADRGARGSLAADARAELLHAVACHHDLRAARTAEAAALYHANQLDAVAATRPVDSA